MRSGIKPAIQPTAMFKREEVEQVKEPVSVDVKKVTLLQAVEACIRGTGLVATDRNGIIVTVLRGKPHLLFPG